MPHKGVTEREPSFLSRRSHRTAGLEQGLQPMIVAQMVGVDRRSVRRWKQAYLRRGRTRILARPSPGRPPKLTPRQRQTLARWILRRAARPRSPSCRVSSRSRRPAAPGLRVFAATSPTDSQGTRRPTGAIVIPGGISIISKTLPVRGSSRLKSLVPCSQVPCQNSPSTQVTPVTKRVDSIVRRIAPVWGST